MGEVYKANDTRLDRTVALKVLPAALSDNEELRQRFEQEARAVSSLNHPHICTLYDVGSENGVDFIVMEYLEGETLQQRLQRGPLPLEQALRYGIEMAGALDKAHGQGVAHRDVKPGNIIITKEGAMLLDFGLATRLRQSSGEASANDDSSLPTEAKPLTEKGTILGTFQYMAPEQLEGKEADTRTDIFAFGALLYEMVTGKKAFEGESQASLITAIMSAQPQTPSKHVPSSPPLLDYVIQTCLAKDPDDRWQSVADVGRDLMWLTRRSEPDQLPHAPRSAPRKSTLALAALLGALVAGAIVLTGKSTPPVAPIARTEFFIPLPDTDDFPALAWTPALSPNGEHLVYAAVRDNVRQLFLRSMAGLEIKPIEGTEGASGPFFSPDGNWLGFFADGKLKKVPLAGGPPITLADEMLLASLNGASWGGDDKVIVATPSGFARVPSDGGQLEPIPNIELTGGPPNAPTMLPASKGLLFGRPSAGGDESGEIAVLTVDSTEPRVLLRGATPQYSTTGHIGFSRERTLWAAPFDPARVEVTGPSFALTPGAAANSRRATRTTFTIGGHGTLVYIPGSQARVLVWVDRGGVAEPLTEPPGSYLSPRLSPAGTALAVCVEDTGHIVILDLARGGRTRLTNSIVDVPIWTPDGRNVTVAKVDTNLARGGEIILHPVDGSKEPMLLVARASIPVPGAWTPDQKTLAFHEIVGVSNRDIFLVSDGGDPIPYLATPANERSPALSSDGHYIAYVSDESGRDEVYLESFPERSGKQLVSTDGGIQPVWSSDGSELFYRRGNRMMAVGIETEPELRASRPTVLFEGRYATGNPNNPNYAVSSDGQRFLMVKDDPASRGFHVILNAFEGLELTR